MAVYKEINRADGSGVTTFYRISDVLDTAETDDQEGQAVIIDYNQAQNKPSINGVTLIGNKTIEDLGLQPAGDYITNDEADEKFIDEDELEAKNYVNQAELQDAIAHIEHFHREIVEALPVTGMDNVLYMVRKGGTGEDIYNEYIWVGLSSSENGYEFLGTTATDLTDYYKKSQVDAALATKVDKEGGKGLSEQNYTLAEKTKLAGLENYDDTEIQAEVSGLNTDVNNLKSSNVTISNTLTELKSDVDSNTAAVSTIYDLLDNKMTAIRLVEQGDGWIWMNLEGSRLTYAQASAALGHENCMLFIEQLENDGKVIPAEYKSEGDHINVIFKDLDSLVHVMTCGEDDAIVTQDVTTVNGQIDFTVEDEAVGYGTMLDAVYGDTKQNNYTGKNLLKNTSTNSGDNNFWEHYSTYNQETGELTRSTSSTSESFIIHKYNFKNNTKYTVSFDIKHNGYVNGAEIYVYKNSNVRIYRTSIPITTNFVRQSFTFTTDDTGFENAVIRFDNNGSTQSGIEATLTLKNVMLVEGEDTDFEPYVGGVPSPNPNYPQDVELVTGYNEVEVKGKNLYNPSYRNDNNSIDFVRCTGNEENGVYTMTATSNDMYFWYVTSLGNNYNSTCGPLFEFKEDTYSMTITNSLFNNNYVTFYDANGISLGYISKNSNIFTISKNEKNGAKYFSIRIGYGQATSGQTYSTSVQLEQSSTATEYESYQGASYSINLGTIELCKIGNCQDKIYKQNNNWYLHKEIGKKVFDGVNGIVTSKHGTITSPTKGLYQATLPGKTTRGSSGVTDKAISNNMPWLTDGAQAAFNNNDYGYWWEGGTPYIYVVIEATTVADANTWFTTHNSIVYYELETPTDMEITDPTLLAQLNALKQITQYKHTYITIAGADLTPEADFTYIDNVVINNTDLVLGKDTYWNDEVPTQQDLPSNAQEGEIRIVQDTEDVYIYNGTKWVPFDKKVDLSNYLAKDNTTPWIPTEPFNPSTKKYVDDSISDIYIPTKTSQLTNDSNFITKNVNDLTNYYLKTNTYTKAEVDALIEGGGGGTGLNGTQLNADCAIDDLINNDTETFYYVGDNEIELAVPIASSPSHTITMTKDSFILIDRSGVYITVVTGGGGVYVFWKDTASQNFYNGGYTLTEEDAYFKRDTYSKQEVDAIIGSPKIWNWASTTNIGVRADKSVASGIYTNYKTYSLFPTITLDASKYSDEYSGFYYFSKNTVENGAGEIIFSSSDEIENTELYFTISNNLVSTVGLRPGNRVGILYHTWTTENGIATSGDDLEFGKEIYKLYKQNKYPLLMVHTNDTPQYIRNTYHTAFDGLYSLVQINGGSTPGYGDLVFQQPMEVSVNVGSANNKDEIAVSYEYIIVRFTNDEVTEVFVQSYLDKANFLSLSNIKEFTPTTDYQPATKKYVDDAIQAALASYIANNINVNPADTSDKNIWIETE